MLGRIFEGIGKGSSEMFGRLSPVARDWFLNKFDHLITDVDARRELYSYDYDRVPPDITTFMDSPDFMGGVGLEIYPGWRPVIERCCRQGAGVSEAILTGAQGRGKCQQWDSLTVTSAGVLMAQEVHELRPTDALTESGAGRITDYHDEGVTDTVKVVTGLGYSLGARPNHRVRALVGGEVVWREMCELTQGDVVLLARGDDVWGDDTAVDPDEALLMGAWVGDGLWDKNTGGVRYSVGPRKEDYARNVLAPAFVRIGMRPKFLDGGREGMFVMALDERRHGLRARWSELGLRTGAGKKVIPRVIRQSPGDVVCAFLRGWFDTDGWVDDKVQVGTASRELARQAQVLMLNLGIITSLTCKAEPTYVYCGERRVGQPSWIVRVVGRRSREVFRSRIGFSNPYKAKMLDELMSHAKASGNVRSGTEPVYGAHGLVAEAWENLRGRVRTRKPHRRVYSPRYGQSNLTKEKLAQMVAIGGIEHLPPVLRRIYEEDLVTDVVISTEKGREHCYDLSVDEDPSYVGNGFISHNTTAAMVMGAYKLTRLSHLRNPAVFYGLAPRTQIVFGLYMVTKKQLKNTGFYTLRDQIIDGMPYFRDVFQRSPYGKEHVEFDHKDKRFLISTSSKSWHVLGLSLFFVAADEMNYFDQGQASAETAREIVTEVSSRLESRFLDEHGDIPGMAVFISQTRTEADYLEQRAQQMRKAKHIVVDRGPRWERGSPRPFQRLVAPEAQRNAPHLVDTMIGKVPGFRVFRGSETSDPRILDKRPSRNPDGSYHVEEVDPNDKPDPSRILCVPVNYYKRFHDDIHGGLRLIADCPSGTFTPFFSQRAVVEQAFDPDLVHPCTAQTVRCFEKQGNFRLADVFQHQRVTNVFMGKRAPIRHPEAPRYIHLDPAKGGDGRDWYGIAMVHPARFMVEDRKHTDDNPYDEAEVGESMVVKDVEVDFYIRLTAGPRGEPVDFKKVRLFIEWLRRIGFWIRKVTSDGWQSLETLQRLRDKGFVSEPLSLDRTSKQYITVRQVFNEGRMFIPYPQGYTPDRWGSPEEALKRTILYMEFISLEENVSKGKVDHRDKNLDGSQGSKDVSDGVVGAAYSCLMDDVAPSDNPLSTTSGHEMVRKRLDPFLRQGIVQRYLPGA
jgi:intein/homing endonuclease